MSASGDPGPDGSLLLTERRGGVLLVTLNRPERLNALNRALQTQLMALLRSIAQGEDPEYLDLRCVILTGAGRGFCSGLDLSDFAASLSSAAISRGDAAGADRDRRTRNIFQAVEALPMPVIAAVNGPAYTGGFELALACDLLIAAPEARFGDTHARLAVMPGAGLSQKLTRIIGLPRAMAVSLAGEALSGEDAYRVGLVSHLVPKADLLPLAWKLGQAISDLEPRFVADLKKLMKDGAGMALGPALKLEREVHEQWAASAQLEAVQARTEHVKASNRLTAHAPSAPSRGLGGDQTSPSRGLGGDQTSPSRGLGGDQANASGEVRRDRQ